MINEITVSLLEWNSPALYSRVKYVILDNGLKVAEGTVSISICSSSNYNIIRYVLDGFKNRPDLLARKLAEAVFMVGARETLLTPYNYRQAYPGEHRYTERLYRCMCRHLARLRGTL